MAIRIETEEHIDYESYIEYHIYHEDGSAGSFDLRICGLVDSYMSREFVAEGLRSDAKVAETFFYPHSDTSQMGKGIGSQVMEFLLSDARRRGIHAVYGDVRDTKSQRFFEKWVQ
jgi:GNAT superfamily N-acetyltransferase